MGGMSILRHFRLPDRPHSQSQVSFPRTKVSSVRNPIRSWLPTVRGENDCFIRYLPTVEKGRVSSSKKSGDLFSAALVRGGVVKSLSGLPCGPGTSFQEATDGRESDTIYVIRVAPLVLAAY